MAARKDINLLPQEEFTSTTFGRVLVWLLSTFRIIVIATELMVMAAFLSRFWLDARNSDLNDLINQKRAIVSASWDFETEFRALQKRLSIFSQITSGEVTTEEILSTITASLPSDLALTGFSRKKDEVEIRGVSSFEKSISQFMANLTATDKFSRVTLGNASSDSVNETLLVFSVKAVVKKGGI